MPDCKHLKFHMEPFQPSKAPGAPSFHSIRCANSECNQLITIIPHNENYGVLLSMQQDIAFIKQRIANKFPVK